MRKRPLCMAACLFLLIQAVLTGWFRLRAEEKQPAAQPCIADNEEVVVSGEVYRREEKSGYQVYYLEDVRIEAQASKKSNTSHMTRDSDSANPSDSRENPGLLGESKILVYIRQENSTKKNRQTEKGILNPVAEDSGIKIGDRIRVSGKAQCFEEPANPGSFDQKLYYEKQGICAMLWGDEAQILASGKDTLRETLSVFRDSWKELLVELLGEKYGGSMSAILLGDKSELDAQVKEIYQKSGIGHILAISGLHMTFIGTGLYRILRKTGCSYLVAGCLGTVFLTLYTLMIGGGVSGVRALVMFAVHMGAEMSGRDYDLATSTALAASLITLSQPLYLLDAGFLLSFGAILGIAVIYPWMTETTRLPKAVCASMSVQIMLLPVQLYFYYEIPPYSILLNVLVIPLMSLVLGAGLVGSLTALIWEDGARLVLGCCKAVLWFYEEISMAAVRLPFGRLVLGKPGEALILLYYLLLIGGIACSVHRRNQNRDRETEKKKSLPTRNMWEMLALTALVSGFCAGTLLGCTGSDKLTVTMLDVGQGDCFHICVPGGENYLIDGGSADEGDIGTYRIEPYLKLRGIGLLDYVFVSHGDADHISGIRELLENQILGIRIETLVLPVETVWDESLKKLADTAARNDTRVVTMEKGEELSRQVEESRRQTGGNSHKSPEEIRLTLTCMAPDETYEGETGNEASMALSLQYGSFRMLFTGDIGKESEEELSQQAVSMKYDILKVAHHGSKNSTGETFLRAVSPKTALISAGKDNAYGHPHRDTISRLEETGCDIYCTQQNGAVEVVTDGETYICRKAE